MKRLEPLKKVVAEALGELDGVLALRNAWGGVAPHLFCREGELDGLALWPKYPLPRTLQLIQKAHPESRIGLACTAEEARICPCPKPYPSILTHMVIGERIEPVADELVEEFLAKSSEERLEFWKRQFSKCIKCYACRTACPQCFCPECTLEDALWVEIGRIPPPFPSFHLVRAMHTVGKCVGCRECELSCPADIPLATLYALIRREVEEMFGYETGGDLEAQPPLVLPMELES